MATQSIEVRPVAGALGAEVSGIDVSQPLSAQQFAALHGAFLDHQVICIRGQMLTPTQQIAFARQFGEPDIYPFIKGLPETPEVIEILKTEKDTVNFGGGWHSDTSYLERPALGSMLYALETPTAGGDTMFASMYSAYDALSDGMKRMLSGLIGVNSSAQGYRGGRAKKMKELDGMKDKYIENSEVSVAEHPIVRAHPQTGRKGLYVSRGHTERFKGMTAAESKPLIDFLADHAVRPEFTCRMRWDPGTLIFWDNRCTQHFAVNDYHGERRRMHRITLVGDRPV
ncbi:MAG: TauD/TfdA family dioxygenase [Rhodospirillaceae bacterium]|nr:TauD/TfdA family dioxygenase [Rhodospirillaceae bacterium]